MAFALAKRLIEAMGGSIGFVSTVGVSSTFWVDLPIPREAATTNPAAAVEEVEREPVTV